MTCVHIIVDEGIISLNADLLFASAIYCYKYLFHLKRNSTAKKVER